MTRDRRSCMTPHCNHANDGCQPFTAIGKINGEWKCPICGKKFTDDEIEQIKGDAARNITALKELIEKFESVSKF